MADEPEDPDAAADRLQAALERIAALASVRPPAPVTDPPDEALSVPEITARLDQLIARLRAALAGRGQEGAQPAASVPQDVFQDVPPGVSQDVPPGVPEDVSAGVPTASE